MSSARKTPQKLTPVDVFRFLVNKSLSLSNEKESTKYYSLFFLTTALILFIVITDIYVSLGKASFQKKGDSASG